MMRFVLYLFKTCKLRDFYTIDKILKYIIYNKSSLSCALLVLKVEMIAKFSIFEYYEICSVCSKCYENVLIMSSRSYEFCIYVVTFPHIAKVDEKT